jgi:hypothetical protein
MTDAEPAPSPGRDWSPSGGPHVFTLRAWLSVERAAGQVGGLDDAVNFLQDRVAHIFGTGVFARLSGFLAARGLDDAAVAGLVDDETALRDLLDHLLADEPAPVEVYAWSAGVPGRSRARWRTVVRNRRRTAELARATPRRPRVAGRRRRGGRMIRTGVVSLHA